MRKSEILDRLNLQDMIDRFFNEDWFIVLGLDGL